MHGLWLEAPMAMADNAPGADTTLPALHLSPELMDCTFTCSESLYLHHEHNHTVLSNYSSRC